MAEYIEREALLEDLDLLAKYQQGERQQGILGVCATIKNIPAADVVEVKHGEWIKREVSLSHKNETLAQCSVCGENGLVESAFPFESCVRRLKYCPYCGAKMDLKEGANK